jgi:hypothetical protein
MPPGLLRLYGMMILSTFDDSLVDIGLNAGIEPTTTAR